MNASILLAAIATATGPYAYPVRVNTTALALRDLADARFSAVQSVYDACANMFGNSRSSVEVQSPSLTPDDGLVLGFFLDQSTALDELR